MKHGGTDHVKGVLNKGTRVQPSPNHGGTNLAKGVVHKAGAPKPSQRSTSWHGTAAASQQNRK